MIKFLTKRIEKIAEYVNFKTIAEVGADHGYITKYLFIQNKIKFAYLTDISSKSLSKAQKNFDKDFKNQVSFLVGDGLNPLQNLVKNKPKQIIIAGIGGKEIVKILAKNTFYTNFILQPQKNVVELRKFLLNNKYKILKDEVVKCGKMYYCVLKVKKVDKQQVLTNNQIAFGKTNLKNYSIDFISYLKYLKQRNNQILINKPVKEILKMQIEIDKLLKRGEKHVWKIIRVSKIRWRNFAP